jgi:hypothetical protein
MSIQYLEYFLYGLMVTSVLFYVLIAVKLVMTVSGHGEKDSVFTGVGLLM